MKKELDGLRILVISMHSYPVHAPMLQFLQERGAKVFMIKNFINGYDALNSKFFGKEYDFAIIGLLYDDLPELPESLREYKRKYDEANGGQMLGFFIEDKLPKLPFIYHTIFGEPNTDRYNMMKSYHNKVACIAEHTLEQIVTIIVKTCKNWNNV